MKLTIASLAVYVTLALIIQEPRTNIVVGHVLDMPPEFLHDTSSNILEMEAMAAISKGARPGGGNFVSDMEYYDSPHKSHHHCSVETKIRIPGKCKNMGRAGIACVAGEYMDLVNQQCLLM